MIIVFDKAFNKDLDKIKDKQIKAALVDIIEGIENAKKFSEIKNLKKLKGSKNFYRIRVGDYRLGIEYNKESITFYRFLLRKDIYKFFP